jgi:GNAT superfamily N-acetyltransferase
MEVKYIKNHIIIEYNNAYISGIIDNEILGITSLFVPGHMRGQGLGTYLIKKLIINAYNDKNIKIIELDDMSDNYRKNNNIYKKLGFYYCERCGPEMRIRAHRFLRLNNML